MSKLRWLQIVVALAVLFAAGFVLLGDNAVLAGRSTRDWLSGHGRWAAALSIALLAGDVLLPTPSSVVMTVNGRLFGVAGGAAVSFAGSMLAWIGCFALGRLVGQAGRQGEDAIAPPVRRFASLAVIATRPVPIVAELVAATAGVSRMSAWGFLVAAAAGTAPICVLYAWVGSRSDSPADSWVALAVAVLAPLALYAAVERPWRRKEMNPPAVPGA